MKRAIREKRRKRCMPSRGDGNERTVSNRDMTINRVWRKRGKDTDVIGEVSGSTAVHDPLRGGLLQRQVGEVLREGGGVP
jgi:hypothetical protein